MSHQPHMQPPSTQPPPSRVVKGHMKTHSMDMRSLESSLNQQRSLVSRMTQPLVIEESKSQNVNVVRSSQPQQKNSNTVNQSRGKSKNRTIKLQDYKFMRASKIIPNYSRVKVPQNFTQKTVQVSRERGMTKNRSFNDLKAYQAKLQEEPNRTINNFSHQYNGKYLNTRSNVALVSNEYGISKNISDKDKTNVKKLKKQRSVRKINLATYKRSYNRLK